MVFKTIAISHSATPPVFIGKTCQSPKMLFLLPVLAHANKTDVVILENGDKITGEIRKLEAGLLEFRTDTMGTVTIQWEHISAVLSDKLQSVELIDGTRSVGRLQKPEDGDHVKLFTNSGSVDIDAEKIISAWPVDTGFLGRMDLDMSLGMDFSKSTDITNIDGAVNFRLRGDDRLTEMSLRTNLTRQPKAEDQTRVDFNLVHQYLLADQKFRTWLGTIQSNDALSINLRLSAGGTFGKYLVKSNSTWFALSAGLMANQENPKENSSETNLEALANLRYRYFRFKDPDRTIDASITVFPSLTDTGRVRTEFKNTFKLELAKDFFWALDIYATHDNRPLNEDAEKTDYGFITSLGWSY